MLQRIYGTAWDTKEDLANYLTKIEEAEKRDHRKLGKQLDLFHFQETAPGMVFGTQRLDNLSTSSKIYARNKFRFWVPRN
ncbi:MAG: hypothetical protein CM15mP93_08180 [Thiotrichaceae bacterium]|nr:MAG: hypothetical protein CM15mP93_08180 [Thiotrichaceae bacterium]